MKNHRIVNLTRGYWLKFAQAARAVDMCAAEWVEFGVSVRDLTLAGAITARNERARRMEPLAASEVLGVFFEPPERGAAAARESRTLARVTTAYGRSMTTTKPGPTDGEKKAARRAQNRERLRLAMESFAASQASGDCGRRRAEG